MIREEIKKLSKPVKLHVFVDKYKRSKNYDFTMSILKPYEENSDGKLTIEELQIGKNLDLKKKYNIQRVPSILFIDNEGNELIRYLAAPQGSEIKPFIQALLIFAGAPNYYETSIKKNLAKIVPSILKVLITSSCAYCPQMVSIASQFALASGGKIKAEIIDITENPDIGDQYDTSSVPYTIINEKKPLIGCFGADELIQELMNEDMIIK